MNSANARLHAVASAYLSLSSGVTGVILSVIAADAELSMSLYGMAMIGIVDVAASILVLLVYQPSYLRLVNRGSDQLTNSAEIRLENKFSFAIGVLMALLGLFLLTDSMIKVVAGDTERVTSSNETLAFAASIYGAVCSLSLAIYKFIIAEKLESAIVFVDALSGLISGMVSLTALIIAANPLFPWWVDSFVGMLLAIYALYSGAHTMISAQRALESQENEEATGKGLEKLVQQFHSSYSYQQESINLNRSGHFALPPAYLRGMYSVPEEDGSELEDEDFEVVFSTQRQYHQLLGVSYYWQSVMQALNPFSWMERTEGRQQSSGSRSGTGRDMYSGTSSYPSPGRFTVLNPYHSISTADDDNDSNNNDVTFEA